MEFLNSFQSEWLKTRRSLAAWLVILGGIFVPFLYTIAGLLRPDKFFGALPQPDFWQQIALQNWNPMAYLMLPMGVVLASSLIAQLEVKNNAWKQVYATPQYFSTIFAAKLAVILVMMVQFFLIFNVGIYLSTVIPVAYYGHLSYPNAAFPWAFFFETSGYFFISCLPIVALQYLLSLRFKNVMIPMGVGICLVIASMISLSWKHGVWLPYTHCLYYMTQVRNNGTPPFSHLNLHLISAVFTLVFLALGYALFYFKKEKN